MFSGVTAHTLGTVAVREGSGGNARRSFAGYVAANYFEVLGVPVARGRGFTAEEGRPGGQALVAVVTHAYWLRTGARADLVGLHVLINEQDVTHRRGDAARLHRHDDGVRARAVPALRRLRHAAQRFVREPAACARRSRRL